MRLSQTSSPVWALKHTSRSSIDSPSPAELNRKRRSPIAIGVERPPYGAFHTRFSPFGDHFVGRPFSSEMPSRAGPRQSVQSLPERTRPEGTMENAINAKDRYFDRTAFMIGPFTDRSDFALLNSARSKFLH